MRDLLRLARILAAAAALAAMTACMGTEKPVVEATGVPVGGGVNVPAGSNEDFIVNVGRRTYFAANSAELDDVAKVTLQKQADWLVRYTGYKIKIEGFADDGGGAESNKTLGLKRADAVRAYLGSLGLKRADAVRAYLGSLGLASARMRTKTFGNLTERLVHNCNDLSCRAQNRRVVTVLERETGV
jgi:peptidoglycan-associated lipoprotein